METKHAIIVSYCSFIYFDRLEHLNHQFPFGNFYPINYVKDKTIVKRVKNLDGLFIDIKPENMFQF